MDSNKVLIKEYTFIKFIDHKDINLKVEEIAHAIINKYSHEMPLFVVLLNGSYVFAADLLRKFDFPVEVLFVKVSSYEDFHSTGSVMIDKGVFEKINKRPIIIIEDIIDTGKTMNAFLEECKLNSINKVEVASLLIKPGKMQHEIKVDYPGFLIGDEFVIGYGLDYNGVGRNLKDLYHLQAD